MNQPAAEIQTRENSPRRDGSRACPGGSAGLPKRAWLAAGVAGHEHDAVCADDGRNRRAAVCAGIEGNRVVINLSLAVRSVKRPPASGCPLPSLAQGG